MAFPMDLLGKFVLWPNAANLAGGVNAAPAAGGPAMALAYDTTDLALTVYSMPPGPPPAVPGGAILVPNAIPWSFTFLRYHDGGITAARLTTAVLTGAMSGCYTFKYTHGGTDFVAHVGTGGNAAATKAVKAHWKSLIRTMGLTSIRGVDAFYDADVVAHVCAVEMPGAPFNKVLTFHYYAGMKVYRILMVIAATVGPNLWKVIRVEELNARPWMLVSMGPKFITA